MTVADKLDKHWDWKPIETAPKDGREILLVMPGAMSDHFHVVIWNNGAWRSRFDDNQVCITENDIVRCYSRPYWVELDDPPTSLCRNDYVPSVEDEAWSERAKASWAVPDRLH